MRTSRFETFFVVQDCAGARKRTRYVDPRDIEIQARIVLVVDEPVVQFRVFTRL